MDNFNKGSSNDKGHFYNKDQTTTTTTNWSPNREGPASNPRPNYVGPPSNNQQGSSCVESGTTWDPSLSQGSPLGILFSPFTMRVFSGLLNLLTGRGEAAQQVSEMARQVNEGSTAFNERVREFQQASQGVDETSRHVGERVREVRESGQPFQHTVTQEYEDKVGDADIKVTREKTVKVTPGRNY